MRHLRYALAAAGLFTVVACVVHFGAEDVFSAVATAGWGMLLLLLIEGGLTAFRAAAWRELGLAESQLRLNDWVAARWLRQSVSQLLPVAQIGGDLVGAQTLHRRGMRAEIAAAVTVVDVTMSASAQMLVTIGALALYGVAVGGRDLLLPMVLVTGCLSMLIGVFLWQQQRGLFSALASRLKHYSRGMLSLVGEAGQLDDAIRRVYSARAGVLRNLGIHVLVQAAGTLEVVAVGILLDAQIGLAHAFLLQALSRAARSAAFFVPGGLGVQDLTIVWLTTAFGIDPVTGVALALMKRGRELLVGVPALAAWPLLAGGAPHRTGR